ncbi:MAG: LOG family protein [Microthrixaceae bacterium]
MSPAQHPTGRRASPCTCRAGGTDPEFARMRAPGGRRAGRPGGIDLVFGGGSIGLMGVVAGGDRRWQQRDRGDHPEALFDRRGGPPRSQAARRGRHAGAQKEMYELADAFLTMPGGIGTMEEFFEVLTWGYLGIHPKPMGLLNVSGYYDPLLAFPCSARSTEGLLKPTVLNLIRVGRDESILDDLVGTGHEGLVSEDLSLPMLPTGQADAREAPARCPRATTSTNRSGTGSGPPGVPRQRHRRADPRATPSP